jgi:type II secretion system (T2SS) protein E
MSANFGAEHIDLLKVQFTPELLQLIPAELVRNYRMMPVRQFPDRIAVALGDVSDINAIDSLCSTLKQVAEVMQADKSQLDVFIQRY